VLDKVRARLKTALWKPSIVFVVALVLLWNWAFSYQSAKAQFPFLVTAQLKFHQFLTNWGPHQQFVKLVRVVDITDEDHWKYFGGAQPTSRAFLADIVTECTQDGTKAAAIAVDVQLQAPPGKAAGEDNSQWTEDDTKLLSAIDEAIGRGVPVILGVGLVKDSYGRWIRQPNIFSDEELPLRTQTNNCSDGGCVALGYFNLPSDMRQIPLQTLVTSDQGPGVTLDSLALATVTGYEERMGLQPKTHDKPLIAESLASGEFVYGGFIPAAVFKKQAIPSIPLSKGDPVARKMCDGHIVLVGGSWHKVQGTGPLEDGSDSPVGEMSGVYLNANYVEALLDDRYKRDVPLWFALTADFLLAAILYIAAHAAAASRYQWWMVWSVFLILLLLVYMLFANFNRYLDFVLPLGLCFAHLGYERVKPFEGIETWLAKFRKKPAEANTPAQPQTNPKGEVKQKEIETNPPAAR
jgi:CHASE2 domain-containing sensor protein